MLKILKCLLISGKKINSFFIDIGTKPDLNKFKSFDLSKKKVIFLGYRSNKTNLIKFLSACSQVDHMDIHCRYGGLSWRFVFLDGYVIDNND